jgi:hypothetical protein
MIDMPIEFSEFHAMCAKNGYTRIVDQRTLKTPANIYAMWTHNGVKVEIKVHKQKKITTYVAGQGLNSEKLEILKNEVESQNMVIQHVNSKHLLIQLQENVLEGFFTLVNIIEDIDAIEQRQAYARMGIEVKPEQTYLFIARVLKLAIEMGQPWAISRGYGGFDVMDKHATVGYSVKGREQENNGKNAYREHMVPCDLMMREGIKMFNEGRSEHDVANMFEQNNKILRISDEEANTLDNILGLKTVMTEGWNFGDDVYSRIKFAGIQPEVDR